MSTRKPAIVRWSICVFITSATKLSEFVEPGTVDLSITSPPYWNILNQRRTRIEEGEEKLKRIEKQLAEVAAMEARVEASRMELLAVSREKRLLEQLEQRHDESTAISTARRESARADELSGQRHQRQQQRPHGEVA